MGRKHNKPRMIPEQDKRICGSICFCQLTVVLSCVSIVYLSAAIYAPSFKAFKSGFETERVMCQTIDFNITNNCRWASCGEWCLTRTSGYCPQIHSTVRRNGTEIELQNCTWATSTSCPQVNEEILPKLNCNNGSTCSHIKGLFNCSMGHCKEMTKSFKCFHKADGPTLDPEMDNSKLNGFFECYGPKCIKIKKRFSCDRICPPIGTSYANVLIMKDNTLYVAKCEKGLALNEARGREPGIKIPPTEFWHSSSNKILLTNCMTVTRDRDKIIKAIDCLNGTLLDEDDLPTPNMNFSQLWKIYEKSSEIVDPKQRFLPKQSNLTIYNSTKLFINLEGCVNTLRGECKDFVAGYGNDGDNNTAQSRYTCFYNKNNSEMVIARYDLGKTYRELLIALILPIVLFVISAITLCVLMKSVKVGDDAKMRCQYCTDDNSDLEDSYISKNTMKSSKRQKPQLDGDGGKKETKNETKEEAICEVNDQITVLNALESPRDETVGSSRALLPMSPCSEKTLDSKSFRTLDNKDHDEGMITSDTCSDKPLVVVT